MVADSPPSSAAPPLWSRIKGPWEVPSFRWYWAGSLAQAMSQGMQFLVLGWLVLEVTGDKTQLGLTISLYGLPNIAFLLAGGIIADRMDRKLLLMVTQAMVGAMIAGLAALTITDNVALWHIYLGAALLGVLQALNMPARLAMLADLVGERRLLDAVAQFNAAQHAGRIVGPPVAGVLIDQWNIGMVLVLNAACYGASVLLLAMVRGTYRPLAAGRQPLLRHIGEGLSVIRDTPMLLTVLVMTCVFGGFGMSHLQVIPAFAKEQLDSGASEVGLLLLGSGIGALTGSLTLTLMHRAWLYRWLLFCLVTFSALLTLFRLERVLRRPYRHILGRLVLGNLGVHPAGGDSRHRLGMAADDHHNATGIPGRGTGPRDGSAPLSARPALPGSLAPDAGRRRGGLAAGDNRGGSDDPAGGLDLRPGP